MQKNKIDVVKAVCNSAAKKLAAICLAMAVGGATVIVGNYGFVANAQKQEHPQDQKQMERDRLREKCLNLKERVNLLRSLHDENEFLDTELDIICRLEQNLGDENYIWHLEFLRNNVMRAERFVVRVEEGYKRSVLGANNTPDQEQMERDRLRAELLDLDKRLQCMRWYPPLGNTRFGASTWLERLDRGWALSSVQAAVIILEHLTSEHEEDYENEQEQEERRQALSSCNVTATGFRLRSVDPHIHVQLQNGTIFEAGATAQDMLKNLIRAMNPQEAAQVMKETLGQK